MSKLGKAFIAAVMIGAASIGFVAVAEAQPPIRIGTSASKSGTYAAQGQNQLRGYGPRNSFTDLLNGSLSW